MKQRKTGYQVFSCCLLLMLMPVRVSALNLGDIELKSEPEQPLAAEIPLSGVSDEVRDSLTIGLADVAGFRWAGIEWSPELNRLQFELRDGAGGAGSIRIHSDEAVRTSRLHFLLKVAWSKGRLFREYTLELDAPPHGADSSIQAGEAPGSAARRQDAGIPGRGAHTYEVVRNDTLWEIARALRPDSSVSIQQMMLALLRTNPDAFSYENINWLKAGEPLWMPNDFELHALSKTEALARVFAQNNFWREARGLPVAGGSWLADTGTAAAEGELRLVAVDEETAAAGGGISADGPDVVAGQEALALANEQVAELAQEKAELEDQLSEAGTIIEDLRRLVELKDDELAALQAQEIVERADPGPDLVERVEAARETAAKAGSDLAERIGATYDSATDALSGEKVKSIYDRVRDNWQLAAALPMVLLALAGWLLLRRNPAHARKGLAAPAASVRHDFAKVAIGRETVSPGEDNIREAGAVAEELEFADGMEEAGRGTVDEEEAGEEGIPGEIEAWEEDIPGEVEDEEDTVQNRLDLAKAFLELGDSENVQSILDEVLAEGNAAQREDARQLLARIESL